MPNSGATNPAASSKSNMHVPFSGAKIAIFFGEKVLVHHRDNKPNIPNPNMWDFPGGRREGEETAFECVKRELFEEFGLTLNENQVLFSKPYPSVINPGTNGWLVVAKMDEADQEKIKFGDEGQAFDFCTPEEILTSDTFVPYLKERFRDYYEHRDINNG